MLLSIIILEKCHLISDTRAYNSSLSLDRIGGNVLTGSSFNVDDLEYEVTTDVSIENTIP